jgi:hypothetical protein
MKVGIGVAHAENVLPRAFQPDLVADGVPVTGVTGAPAMIQGTWGAAGNFELLVPMGDRIAHFYRDNDAPGLPWHRNPDLPRLTGGVPAFVLADPVGVGFFQSNFIPSPGVPAPFEVVARMRPRLGGGADYLVTYTFDSVARRWVGPAELPVNGQTVAGVTGF